MLMLGQALLGAISDNFRMVALRFEVDYWVVEVWLRRDDKTDREKVKDIVEEFGVFLEDTKSELTPESWRKIVGKVTVTDAPLDLSHSEMSRVVFLRREDR